MNSSSKFDAAFDRALAREGGYVNDPDDPGGATKYGISLRWLKSVGDADGNGLPDGDFDGDGDVDADDIKLIDTTRARDLYRRLWWDRLGYEQFPTSVAVKLFDHAINMGEVATHKCLQRAATACLATRIEDDGVLGPQTRYAVQRIDVPVLLPALRAECASHYRYLVALKPTRQKYIKGWLNRAYDLV